MSRWSYHHIARSPRRALSAFGWRWAGRGTAPSHAGGGGGGGSASAVLAASGVVGEPLPLDPHAGIARAARIATQVAPRAASAARGARMGVVLARDRHGGGARARRSRDVRRANEPPADLLSSDDGPGAAGFRPR